MSEYRCPNCGGGFPKRSDLVDNDKLWDACIWCGQALDGSHPADAVPREQLETALRFLEWSHGDALRREWSDESHAYYMAVEMVEDAMNGKLRPVDEIRETDWERERIGESREARNTGYRAATMLGQDGKDKDREEGGGPIYRKLIGWLE